MKKLTGNIIRSIAALTASVFVTAIVAGCGGGNGGATEKPIAVGNPVRLEKNVEFDYDRMVFDDFTGGVTAENWYIAKQAWGANGNGGVVPQNVNYTDDGVLVLSGNGDYYTSGDVKGVGQRRDGTLTGAALISKFLTGPGRYEVKMKVLPRLGACSAFWTYAYDNDTMGNHEIDIELPGGTRSSMISFENVLNTNYIKESSNISNDQSLAEVTNGKVSTVTDGEWHTFGFDWYTTKEGDDETTRKTDGSCGKVVYYIDGVITSVNEVFVPYYQSRLWLGVWFPNNPGFVGSANFESDCMYVDWVRYTPFVGEVIDDFPTYKPAESDEDGEEEGDVEAQAEDDIEYADPNEPVVFNGQPVKRFTPPLTGDVATADEYPSAPVTTKLVNKVANGDFEYVATGAANSGWELDKRVMTSAEIAALRNKFKEENSELTTKEINDLVNDYRKELNSKDASEYVTVADGLGHTSSAGLKIEKIGWVGQSIDSVYAGYKTELSFAAKGKGKIVLQFMGNGTTFVEEHVIEFDGADFKSYVKELVAPEGTKRIDIIITSDFDEAAYIDNVILQVKL